MSNPMRVHALAHAGRGWRVFPLWPNTKIPAIDAWEHAATTDPAVIARWWARRPYNIAVAVGPSGLFVIDLDAPKPSGVDAATTATTATTQLSRVADRDAVAGRSATSRHGRRVFLDLCATHRQAPPADTHMVATPSGGWHLYFRHPASGPKLRNTKGGTARSLGPLVDTRGHGGFVVAAGSVLDGCAYRPVRDLPPAPLPEWLATVLRDLDAAGPAFGSCRPVVVRLLADGDRRARYLNAAIARELDHVRGAPAERGNAALWGAAVALGQLVAGGELDAAHVTDLLEQASTAAGRRTAAEARATIASGLRRGAQRPRTVTT